MSGVVEVKPNDLVPFLSRHQQNLEQVVLGPFQTTDEDDLKLPWIDLFHVLADCPRLNLMEFGLNDFTFECASKKEVDACLERMLSGTSIEEEAARW